MSLQAGIPAGTINLYQNDLKVIPNKPVDGSGPRLPPRKRGKVTIFTPRSRKQLLFYLRNFQGRKPQKLPLVTLTYPTIATPENGALVKAHIVKLRKWLVRQELSGVWVIEFHRDGRPHIHMVLNGYVEISKFRQAWGAIIGYEGPRVHIKADWDQVALANYLAKRVTKTAPASFGPIGRYWAQFGPAKVAPESTIPVQSETGAEIRKMVTTTRKSALLRKGYPEHVADEWSNRAQQMTGWGMAKRARRITDVLSTEPEHTTGLKKATTESCTYSGRT